MAHVLSYGNKTCTKYYNEGCDNCDTCIFDDDYNDSEEMDSRQEIKKCNNCMHSKCTVISHGSTKSYNNWHCAYGGTERLLDMSVPSDRDIEIPSFCPLKYNKQIETKPTFKCLTYAEKRELLENIPPLMKWDDIEEKQVYHVPPIPSETRKDIYIVSKNDFSCTYKVLNSSYSNTILTMYKTSAIYKYMMKHRLKKIEVVNVTSQNK